MNHTIQGCIFIYISIPWQCFLQHDSFSQLYPVVGAVPATFACLALHAVNAPHLWCSLPYAVESVATAYVLKECILSKTSFLCANGPRRAGSMHLLLLYLDQSNGDLSRACAQWCTQHAVQSHPGCEQSWSSRCLAVHSAWTGLEIHDVLKESVRGPNVDAGVNGKRMCMSTTTHYIHTDACSALPCPDTAAGGM